MPHALAHLAGDALPPGYRSLLRRYRYGPATVKVDWALDGPIPWEAAEARSAGTVHVAGGEEELLADDRRQRHAPARSTVPPRRAAVARRPITGARGQAHGLGLHARPARPASTGAPSSRRSSSASRRRSSGSRRGFRDRILARHVLSPAELERRDRNLVGGDVGGGSYRLRQVVFRPVPRCPPTARRCAGLYLGSAAAFPGGAVHGVPGDAAARAALADGRSGF